MLNSISFSSFKYTNNLFLNVSSPNYIVSDQRDEETPGPFPNPEVKFISGFACYLFLQGASR